MTNFSGELRRLFSAAGDPTLKSVSDAVIARSRDAGVTVRGSMISRLSDWRSGKHLPRDFDGPLRLVIIELLDRAAKRDAVGDLPTRLSSWQSLWRQAQEQAHTEASAHIDCPYPGLAPYRLADADHYFGRGADVAEVAGLVFAAVRRGGGMVSVVGVSGSGKSSLLAAGVTPRLLARGLTVATMEPGEDPGAQLDRILAEDGGAATALVLIVDQAEEVATVADPEQAERFLTRLGAVTAGDGPVPVVALIGLRADFVGDWLSYPQLLGSLNRASHMLGAMSRTELTEAITGPAAAVGVKFESGLTERLVAELAGPGSGDYDAGALPLLSHALATLWEHRNGNQLTVAAYDAAGGVRGALNDTAEQVWLQLTPQQQTVGRRMLLRLVHLGDRTRDARVARPREELLAGDAQTRADRGAVLDALQTARLVTVDADDRVGLTHEVLIGAWTRLRSWVDDDRAGLLEAQRLEAAAEEWSAAGRDPSLLLRGSRLTLAERAASAGEVSDLAAEFVVAGEATARRSSRLRSAAVIALAAITVVALLLSLAAYQARSRAQNEQRSAELGRLGAESDRLQLSSPTVSARLALLAAHLDPSDENRSRLVVAENLPLAAPLGRASGAVYSIDVDSGGRRVAAAGSDGALRIWPLNPPRRGETDPLVLPGHQSFVTSVHWSPDGSRLASTSDDGTVGIWDRLEPGARPRLLRGHEGRVVFSAWSPDGRRLATAGMDRTVRVWDTATGRQLAVLTGHTGDVRAVDWSPDGRLIASGASDSTARLFSAGDYRQVGVISGHTDLVHAVAFSPDGRLLATGSDDSTVRLWDVSAPAEPHPVGLPLTRHTGPVWSVEFSADGRRLISASVDGTARLWSVVDPATVVQVGPTLQGAASSLFSAAFTPDGRGVVTAGADGVIRRWSPPPTVLEGHSGRVIAPAVVGDRMLTGSSDGSLSLWDMRRADTPQSLDQTRSAGRARIEQVSLSADEQLAAAATGAGTVEIRAVAADGRFAAPETVRVSALDQHRALFAPTGRLLLTSGRDDEVRLWSVADDGSVRARGPAMVHDRGHWCTAAAWSPDGTTVVTGGANGRLAVWNVRDPDHPQRLAVSGERHAGTVNTIAVSQDGRTVASGGDDGELRLWSIESGELRPIGVYRHERGSTVRTLTFADDGRRLVSAGDGQSLLVWNSSDPAHIGPIGAAIGVAGAGRWYADTVADGSVVITGGDYGSLIVNPLNPDYARDRICGSTAPLDDDSWNRYVPGSLGRPDPCR